MSGRQKRGKRQRASRDTRTANTRRAVPPSRPKPSALIRAEGVLEECVGAICLAEVTLHSLESQEIASPEQEVLKRALKAIWIVHDWIYELRPDDLDGEGTDLEDEP